MHDMSMQELKTWLPAAVTLVHLPQRENAGMGVVPDYLLRSQPYAACMSTMEAIARFDITNQAFHLLNNGFHLLLIGDLW